MGSSKKVTIGYQYFLGAHMAICHSPVKELQAIKVGDRDVWTMPVTASSTIFIDEPNIFGGAKKEGGVSGNVDIAFGEETQAKNPYLVTQLGNNIPAFRGVLSVILNKCYVSSMTNRPKPWTFLVKSIPAEQWQAALAEIPPNPAREIPGGSANPIHIIYEALTNTSWGAGIDPSELDAS